MPIYPQGLLNTTSLVVPDLYVLIVPPQPALNGVPSNVLGVVGTAAWGPINTPTTVGNYQEFQSNFGPLQNATFDMGTHVAIAVQQLANNFMCVRVTDGTDVKATGKFGATTADITFTAMYSGTVGNGISVAVSAGGATSSWNCSVNLPALGISELFTNITGTGNAFWVNLANAINNGQSATRGPSQIVTAVVGAGIDVPSAENVTLASGTNGATTITASVLVGTDGVARTGMYALRGKGVSVAVLADATDVTQWTAQNAFALQEGIYMMLQVPAGTTIAAAQTDVQTAGIDSYACKIMHGDWLYWYDQVNAVTRMVSPSAFTAGIISALAPNESSLNKQLNGIIGSQTSGVVGTSQLHTYSSADLQSLFMSGIDVICNPQPGGNYWGVRGGINSSLNDAVNGDNYTRMTNYIAATLNAAMGQFVGQDITPSMDKSATSTISSFLSNMKQQSMLGDPNGPNPFVVQGGLGAGTPNPQNRTAIGYYQINVSVTYAPINKFFIVGLQGGQTVVTSS